MRVGTRVGPFYASTSTKGCGPFVLIWILILLAVGFPVLYPAIGIPIYAVIIGLGVWWFLRARRRARTAVITAAASEPAAEAVDLDGCPRCQSTSNVTAIPTGFRCGSCQISWRDITCPLCGVDLSLEDTPGVTRGECPMCRSVVEFPR